MVRQTDRQPTDTIPAPVSGEYRSMSSNVEPVDGLFKLVFPGGPVVSALRVHYTPDPPPLVMPSFILGFGTFFGGTASNVY